MSNLSPWQSLYSAIGLWGLAFLLPLYLLALIRGDPAGRGLVHAVAIGAALATLLALSGSAALVPMALYNEELGIDVLVLAMITTLALRIRRFYPLVMAALQLLIATTSALGAAGLIAQKGTHAAMVGMLTMAMLGVLIYGQIAHRQRRALRKRSVFRDSNLAPRANRAR